MIDERFYTRLGPLRLEHIVDGLDVELTANDKAVIISDAAQLDLSASGSVSYYGGKAHIAQLSTARASACFTNAENANAVSDAGLIPLICEFPRAAFGASIDRLYRRLGFSAGQDRISPRADIAKSASILPGAVIGEGAQIGENVTIGPNSVIYPGVIIGQNTVIDANVTVQCTVIGKNCRIHSGTVLGGEGFGIAPSANGAQEIAHIGRVIIEDHVSIGCSSAVDRGMLGDTHISARVKIDNLCHIAHNCTLGANTIIAGQSGMAGSVTLGAGVIIGGRAGIADHIKVGAGATLAGSSGITRDVPPGETWAGFPAKPIRQFMRESATISKLVKAKKPKT